MVIEEEGMQEGKRRIGWEWTLDPSHFIKFLL